MKKLLSVVTALLLVVGLSACGGKKAVDCKVTTVMVTDSGGVDDKSFNEVTHDGLVRFADELSDKGACNAKAIQSSTDSDLEPNLTSVSGQKNDLVVAAGFKFNDALASVSKKYPKQKYLVIDTVVEGKNITSAVFAAHEGSFLAGVAAAEKAKEAGKNKVGFIGGSDSPIIAAFGNGFAQGVKAVDSKITVKIDYVGDFKDASKAKIMATQMYKDGTYIIYQAAGDAGNGVISAAKELVKDQGKDVWVVGVDKDQFDTGKYDGEKSVILTSMVKKMDVAAFDVAKSVLDGKFVGGDIINFNLKNGGVGLPEKNPNLNEKIMKSVEKFKEKIISGEIKVTE